MAGASSVFKSGLYRVCIPGSRRLSPRWAPWWVGSTAGERKIKYMESQTKKRCLETDTNQLDNKSISNSAAAASSDTWPRFLIISSPNNKLNSLSPFAVEKGIVALAGEPKSVKKLRSGDLLVEVTRKAHSDLLLKSKELALVPITVSPHRALNSKKGVLRCRELAGMTEREIQQDLSDQHVSEVKRISITRDGKRVPTGTYILTFQSAILPSVIKVGYMRVPVQLYIPNPLRCYKCQHFGHHRENCRLHDLCARCGGNDHSDGTCQLDPKCVNCGGNHESRSRECPVFKKEKDIITIKVTNNVSYPEAKKQYNTQNMNRMPTTHKSYAAAVTDSQITKKSIETQTTITWPINDKTFSIIKSVQTQGTPLVKSVTTQSGTGTRSGDQGKKSRPAARSKSQDHRTAPKGEPEVGSGASSKPRTREKKGDPGALLLENYFDVLSDSTGDEMELDAAPTSPVRGKNRKDQKT